MKRIKEYKQEIEKKDLDSIFLLFILAITSITALGYIILNFLAKPQMRLMYKWIILFFTSLIGFYFIYIDKYVKLFKYGLLIIGTTIIIPYTWFLIGGSNNYVEYYVIFIIVISCVVFERKTAIVFVIYNIIQMDALIYIEHIRPDLVKQTDRQMLFINKMIILPTIFIILAMILLFIFKLYNKKTRDVAHLNQELAKEAKLKNILLEIMQQTPDNYDIKDVCHIILAKMVDIMDAAEKGSIMSIGYDEKLFFQASVGYDINILNSIDFHCKESYLYKATDGKMDRTVMINTKKHHNLEPEKEYLFKKANHKFNEYALCAPIKVKETVWGIITIDSYNRKMFNESDKEFLTIFAAEIEKILLFSIMMKENEQLRNRDYLTNIYNRLYFNEQYLKLVNDSCKCVFALVAIDLNKFKRINDTYGHQSGDEFLIYFVECAQRFLNQDDIFARFGGDEFQVLLPNQSKIEAKETIKAIMSWCDEHPITFEGHKETVQFSFGIAEYPNEADDFEKLLAIADEEMYYYKKRNYL